MLFSIVDYGWLCSYFLDLLYPPRCRSCGEPIRGPDARCFCPECTRSIRLIAHPLCDICGQPFIDAAGEDHSCGACLSRPPTFTRARAWACYPRDEGQEDPLRTVLQRFKYGKKVSLGPPLGKLLSSSALAFFRDVSLDLVVPVPLHPRRLRWRGFNQAAILAREIGRSWHMPMDPFILFRSRETVPQTGLKGDERRKNVSGVFRVEKGESVRNKRLLLVDDVYTSGATVNECSRVLRRAGAVEIYVLTLARAV